MKKLKQKSDGSLGVLGLVLFLVFLLIMGLNSFSQSLISNQNLIAENDGQNSNTLQEMIEYGVADANDFVDYGRALMEEQPSLAEDFFQYAISLNPDLAEAYSGLYYTHISNGIYDSAEFYARKAIDIKPGQVQPHLDLALAILKQKRRQEAYEQVAIAARIDADYVTKVGSKFIIEHNSISGALYYFKIVHKVDPNNQLNNLNYSYALRISGHFKRALEVLTGTFDLLSQGDSYFDACYSLYFKLLMDIEDYEKVVLIASNKVEPTYPHQYLYKALSHYKLGEISGFEDNSRRYFQYHTELPPRSLTDWANHRIGEIEKIRG